MNTASDSAQDVNKQFGLRAMITYSDNTKEFHYVPFNTDLTEWQYTSMAVVPKQPGKTVSTIRVLCAYEANINTAYFDNISLVREAAQTMTYDADGNLQSVASTGLQKDTSTYSSGNLIKTITGGNGTFTYSYDATYPHRLKSVTNGIVTQSMLHDAVGNVTSTTLTGTGTTDKIVTSATYGGNQNRLVSVTDATGATVSYNYDNANVQMLALPTRITDPSGTVTSYTYDSRNRVSQTGIENWANLSYTYTKGNLTSVARVAGGTTQTYSFAYDGFGNMTSAKVGSRTLSTYTYGANNGPLTKQTYGNGDTVAYTYDDLGRVKTSTTSDGKTVVYTYNGEGKLHSATTGNWRREFENDTLGRPFSSAEYKQEVVNGEQTWVEKLRLQNKYNDKNQLINQFRLLPDKTITTTYSYDNYGRLNSYNPGAGGSFVFSYDGLSRIASVSTHVHKRSYTYEDGAAENTTTNRVSRYALTSAGAGQYFVPLTYNYTYDEDGNILTITDPISGNRSYTYDELGQMLTETIAGTAHTHTAIII